jgi:hypothetical protein
VSGADAEKATHPARHRWKKARFHNAGMTRFSMVAVSMGKGSGSLSVMRER